jgi:cbb3-type cytochrome oxidase maturation protein
MSALFLLIGVSFFIALIFLVAFIFSVRTGQFDDTYTPSVRILFDDEKQNIKTPANNLINKD